MNELKSPDDARRAFAIQDETVYHDFIAFKDGKPGFSLKRSYPDDIAFKPPVTKSGTADTVAMIRVLFNPERLPDAELDPSSIPLLIDIGKHSKYHYAHFGYNHEDEDCPTAESLAASRDTPEPVDLQFLNEYAFDRSHGDFVDANGHRMSGQEVLQSVFDQHCGTTRPTKRRVWGSIARTGMACGAFISALETVLRVCFRKRFDTTRSPLRPFRKEDIVLLEAEPLEFFSYKTTKNVVVTYAALVLIVYFVALLTGVSGFKPLAGVWNHPFLALCATLVTLPLLEHQGPQLIRHLANLLKRIRLWSIMHSPVYGEVERKQRTRRDGRTTESNATSG